MDPEQPKSKERPASSSEETISVERPANSTEETVSSERDEHSIIFLERGDMAYWSEMSLVIEKARVSATVRCSHLAKLGRQSKKTVELGVKIADLEEFIDRELAVAILTHPTWLWASRIKGIGRENYPKVIGLIEQFGTYYDEGDVLIPPYVDRQPAPYKTLVDGKPVERPAGIYVEGIERLTNPSKLWKYAGYAVDESGKAARRTRGKKLGYNSQLRMCLFRLAGSLMRAKGIWYTGGDRQQGYSRGYVGHRDVIRSMKEAQGFQFLPPPKERHCVECGLEVKKKAALFCPECSGRLSLKEEPKGVIWLGHLDMMARRKMIKDFLVCLWLVWRQALGLPTPVTYGERFQNEPALNPWKMLDR